MLASVKNEPSTEEEVRGDFKTEYNTSTESESVCNYLRIERVVSLVKDEPQSDEQDVKVFKLEDSETADSECVHEDSSFQDVKIKTEPSSDEYSERIIGRQCFLSPSAEKFDEGEEALSTSENAIIKPEDDTMGDAEMYTDDVDSNKSNKSSTINQAASTSQYVIKTEYDIREDYMQTDSLECNKIVGNNAPQIIAFLKYLVNEKMDKKKTVVDSSACKKSNNKDLVNDKMVKKKEVFNKTVNHKDLVNKKMVKKKDIFDKTGWKTNNNKLKNEMESWSQYKLYKKPGLKEKILLKGGVTADKVHRRAGRTVTSTLSRFRAVDKLERKKLIRDLISARNSTSSADREINPHLESEYEQVSYNKYLNRETRKDHSNMVDRSEDVTVKAHVRSKFVETEQAQNNESCPADVGTQMTPQKKVPLECSSEATHLTITSGDGSEWNVQSSSNNEEIEEV